MNTRTSYILAVILSAVGVFALSPAFAQEQPCPDCIENNDVTSAQQALLRGIPVSIRTDAEVYDHNSIIMVEGTVANLRQGIPITVTVTSPTNNVVTIGQIDLNSDGTYATTLKTSGAMWKYDGTYTIRVQYGSHNVSNKVLIELKGGVPTNIAPTPTPTPVRDCTSNELSIDDQCIAFSITGGSVTGGYINSGTSIVIEISSVEPGMITLSPTSNVFRDLVLTYVDGEQWDDVTVDGNNITIQFPAGTETIEILGKFVIPEFGTIAALILAVAIISIIAVSARTRLSIMPKY